MRSFNRDSLPHFADVGLRLLKKHYFTFTARLAARWWGVHLGGGCAFVGRPKFQRFPKSTIFVGHNCTFNSSSTSNLIGINHPCIFATLKRDADIQIGAGCGFSGTTIGCATRIILGDNVRCGANTLITDTDWHGNDPRTGADAPVEIGDNVWLGINVTVLKGVIIGNNTLVGAGSLVTKSLPPNVIAAGTPARVIRTL